MFYNGAQNTRKDAALHEGGEEGEAAVAELAKEAAKRRGLAADVAERLYGDKR